MLKSLRRRVALFAVLAIAGCASAYAAVGYLATTQYGVRFLPISTSAKPDNCGSGRYCEYVDTNGSPRYFNGTFDQAFVLVSPSPSPMKGDLVAYNGSNSYVTHSAAGESDGLCLKKDSTKASGLDWDTCAAGGSDSLQDAYDTGNTIDLATSTPFSLTPGDAGFSFQVVDNHASPNRHLFFSAGDGSFGSYGAYDLRNSLAGVSGSIGDLTAVGLDLYNTSAATVGQPLQNSPMFTQGCTVWDTDDSVGRDCGFRIVTQGSSGTSTSQDVAFLMRGLNGGGFAAQYSFGGTGNFTAAGTVDATGIGNSGSTFSLDDNTSMASGKTLTVNNVTTNGFVGPNYGGTSTNVPTVTWHEIGAGGEPAFANSWVNDGTATYPTAAFHKDSLGRVTMKGYIKSGTSFSAVAFTLPAGYRPTQRHFFPCYAAAACLGQVNTNGEVSYLAGATTGSTVTTTFFAEQ